MTKAVAVLGPSALLAALGWALPIVAEAKIDRQAGGSSPVMLLARADSGRESRRGGEPASAAKQTAQAAPEQKSTDAPAPAIGEQRPAEAEAIEDAPPEGEDTAPAADGNQSTITRPAGEASGDETARFQLPPQAGPSGGPPRPTTQFLKFQYSFGSESDAVYRREPDLDRRVRDDSLILAPQVNGYVIYRPTDKLEFLLEGILEREVAVREQKVLTLPNGETRVAEKRRTSLVIDQGYVRLKPTRSFDIILGRRNFEDERRWVYDTSLDTAYLRLRQGALQTELSVARKDSVDLDLARKVKKGRINNYIFYTDYRGIEDVRLAAYTIYSVDSSGREGRPLHLGLRGYGAPTDRFSFWSELAFLRGTDEFRQRFSARAIDVGVSYRFTDLPFFPGITLSYASGSGDGNPNDNKNHEFRQTGLQSNELRAIGVSKFKYYGEALDPELSNVRIFTLGLGARLSPTVFLDLVYHRYRLDKLADQIRNSAITALMNQDDTQLSKDVGSGFDIVVGLRNLFGIRRFGVDLRAGLFFPGKAFRNDITTDPDNPVFRRADKGFSFLAKFWW
jgi:alginate production protein